MANLDFRIAGKNDSFGAKEKMGRFQRLMESRGVEATVVGEFTDSKRCIVKYESKTIMDIDLEFLHNGLPKRPLVSSRVTKTFPEPKAIKISRYKNFRGVYSLKNISGFSFISDQYDHEVQASSVLKPTSGRGRINTDAQVFCPIFSSQKGVILSVALSVLWRHQHLPYGRFGARHSSKEHNSFRRHYFASGDFG